MKTFAQHTIWALSLAAMVTSMVLSGCGSSDGGGGGVVGPGVVVPVGPAATTCPAGQVMTQYNCLYTATCQSIAPGYGWLPGENRCVPPIAGTGGGTTVTSGNFLASFNSINDRRTFELMLQNLGMCSPYVVGINLGSANCENYSHAGYLQLQVSVATSGTLPAQANVVVGAGASTPNGFNSSWSTGGRVLRPSFPTNLAYANSNAGFTGAATFVSGSGQETFRFVVNQGLPWNSYQMTVHVQYRGITFATGTLMAQ